MQDMKDRKNARKFFHNMHPNLESTAAFHQIMAISYIVNLEVGMSISSILAFVASQG